MRGLDIVRMIISAGRSHASWNDMVRNDFPVIGEHLAANPTFHLLLDNLAGQQSFHFSR